MPITDAHAANHTAAFSLWGDDKGSSLSKVNCVAHVQHKIGEWCAATNPNEAKGVLHSTWAFSFGGKTALFRKTLKALIKSRLRVYEGEGDAGQDAFEHRERVLRQYA